MPYNERRTSLTPFLFPFLRYIQFKRVGMSVCTVYYINLRNFRNGSLSARPARKRVLRKRVLCNTLSTGDGGLRPNDTSAPIPPPPPTTPQKRKYGFR